MRLEEYLDTVTDQIRCTKARELVSGELRAHILDQAEAYEQDGMFEAEALEKAVREMGDPVETGVSLDRIHRPQVAWGLLLMVGILGALGAGIHYILGMRIPEYEQVGNGYFKNCMVHMAISYLLMLAVYRLDYSILGRWGKAAAAGFLAVVIGLTCLTPAGEAVNGSLAWLELGPFALSVCDLMYLYVPLYGAALYQYRGEGARVFWKIALWTVIPVLFVGTRPHTAQAALLGLTLLGLLSASVWKGWFAVNRKRTLAALWLLSLLLPLAVLLLCWAGGRLEPYQAARLQAFFNRDYSEYCYLQQMLQEVMGDSRLIGGSAALTETSSIFWALAKSGYLLAYLIGVYGILAGALLVGFLILLVVKVFRISSGQKNQLGMIVGCGCGMVYLFQIAFHLANNLLGFPTSAGILPFLSNGGTGQLVSGILMGLVLSVYRYKNILAEKPVKKKAQAVS